MASQENSSSPSPGKSLSKSFYLLDLFLFFIDEELKEKLNSWENFLFSWLIWRHSLNGKDWEQSAKIWRCQYAVSSNLLNDESSTWEQPTAESKVSLFLAEEKKRESRQKIERAEERESSFKW